MKNYENQICEAVDIIASKKIQEAKFNSIVKGSIIELSNSNYAEYKVKYQDSIFTAYGLGKSIQYKKDTLVYILIPNNDFTERKIILGSVLVDTNSLSQGLDGYVDDEGYLNITLNDLG